MGRSSGWVVVGGCPTESLPTTGPGWVCETKLTTTPGARDRKDCRGHGTTKTMSGPKGSNVPLVTFPDSFLCARVDRIVGSVTRRMDSGTSTGRNPRAVPGPVRSDLTPPFLRVSGGSLVFGPPPGRPLPRSRWDIRSGL